MSTELGERPWSLIRRPNVSRDCGRNAILDAVLRVGGDERDRTVGLLSAIQALSQLSYIPITLDLSVERGAILRSGGRNATDRFR